MKNFITYISEKLKISKDTQPKECEEDILNYLDSRFCDFRNDYDTYKYTIGKDDDGWYVDVQPKKDDDFYRTRSGCSSHDIFEGWRHFNKYVDNHPNNEECWKKCPEFRYRNISGRGLAIIQWQKLDSLEGIENVENMLYLEGCITNGNKRIKVDGLNVNGEIRINHDGFQIRGYDPKKFFEGDLTYKDISIV